MSYGWILLALLAGLWTGLALPFLHKSANRRTEQNQEQLLNEWLYGKSE